MIHNLQSPLGLSVTLNPGGFQVKWSDNAGRSKYHYHFKISEHSKLNLKWKIIFKKKNHEFKSKSIHRPQKDITLSLLTFKGNRCSSLLLSPLTWLYVQFFLPHLPHLNRSVVVPSCLAIWWSSMDSLVNLALNFLISSLAISYSQIKYMYQQSTCN